MLAPGGALVAYGTASTKDVEGDSRLPVLKLLARLALWNALPNKRRAHFFNLWAGRRNAAAFRAGLADDLGRVFALAVAGDVRGQVAARLPLTDAAAALRLAESRTVVGKVVLEP
ncbi:zinc-binding dehydrogenase [Nocardia sp. NPDC057353]|uniref:zinc-binding dehydrogenase n=1 Tax=Nocardia sp. NPDC057353 TaxID=3346104 RepID=UPI0036327806